MGASRGPWTAGQIEKEETGVALQSNTKSTSEGERADLIAIHKIHSKNFHRIRESCAEMTVFTFNKSWLNGIGILGIHLSCVQQKAAFISSQKIDLKNDTPN